MFKFPQLHTKNIALFYLLTILGNSWFFMGNWLFFWLRFMTYGQLGWIDALAFAFGMVMEIPTGAISDLVGKKKTLVLAMALTTLGFLIISPATHRYQILLGFLIVQAGWAFYSGAAEALAYDTLKEKGEEKDFDKVISTSSILGIAASVICSIIGIGLYNWHFRAPHFAIAVTYGIAFILTWFLREPKIDSEKFSFANYFSQMGQGVHQLVTPALRRFLPLIFVLLGIYYMYSYGFVRAAVAEHLGFMATEQGYLFAGLSVVTAMMIHAIPWMRQRFNDIQGLVMITLVMGAGFLLASLGAGWWGVFVLTFIFIAGNLAQPWISVVVNRELDSRYRATTLSTISMLTKVPYILVAVLAGRLIQDGYLNQFNLAVGTLTILVVIASVGVMRKEVFTSKAS